MEDKIQISISDLKRLLEEQKKLMYDWIITYDFCFGKGDRIWADLSKIRYPDDVRVLEKYIK